MTEALLVIYASVDGRDNWHPILPEETPSWLKAPDVMGRLVAGYVAMKADEGENGSLHYRAERVTS